MGRYRQVFRQAFQSSVDNHYRAFSQVDVLGMFFWIVLAFIELANQKGPGGVVDLQVAAAEIVKVLDGFVVGLA